MPQKIRAALESARLTPSSNAPSGSSTTAAHDASVGHPEYGTKATFADLVTETDTAVERFIFESLRARYPNHVYVCLPNLLILQPENLTCIYTPMQ